MQCTLKSLLLESIADANHNTNDPHKYPSQILCLSNSIVFTNRCEESILTNRLPNLLKNLKDDLEMYTIQRIQESNSNERILELKLKDIILDIIHNIEVIENLIRHKVIKITDWYWQKQLR